MRLSLWRSGEVLRRDFQDTAKLESKFVLTSYRSTPRISSLNTRNTHFIRLGEGLNLASHLKIAVTFSLRVVYGANFSSDFLLLLSPL